MTASQRSDYRPDIDGLRAVAVVAVLLFHTFPQLLPGGYAGVDVFFVISGFLISRHLYAEARSQRASLGGIIRRFYARRIRRIFPALALVLAATIAAGYFLLLPQEFEQLCRHATESAGFIANLRFAREAGYFSPNAIANPVLHLWSLGVEEQYYLVWPIAIWVALRLRVGILPMVVFLTALSLTWNFLKPETVRDAAYFLPQYRMWELLAGSLLALAADGPDSSASNETGPPPAYLESALAVLVGTAALWLGIHSSGYNGAVRNLIAGSLLLAVPLVVEAGRQYIASLALLAAAAAAWLSFPSHVYSDSGSSWRFWIPVAGAFVAIPALASAAWKTTARAHASALVGFGSRLRRGQAATGLLLVLVSMAFGTSEATVPNLWTVVCVIGAVLVVGAPRDGRLGALLGNRAAVGIGLISYPLYLWHWPLLSFWTLINPTTTGVVDKLAVLGAAFVLAALTTWLVESPLRRRKADWRLIGFLACAMAVIAAVGFYCAANRGFRSRLSPFLKALDRFPHSPPPLAYREGTYFLSLDQDETAFPNDPAEVDPRKPSLFLWGDSYAAALYPGLKQRYGEHYNIIERTAAGNPPVLGDPGLGRLYGVEINQAIFRQIRQQRPDVLVLAARWPRYRLQLLAETLPQLKMLGITRIVVIGPEPEWQTSLAQQLFNYARRHPSAPVPTRLTTGLSPEPFALDPAMRSLCQKAGVDYFSPISVLGSNEGILVRFGDTPDSIEAFDEGHLTVPASDYLIAHLPPL